MIIDSTKQLLEECQQQARKIINYICRTEIEEINQIHFPTYLKQFMIKYITVNLEQLKKEWLKKT